MSRSFVTHFVTSKRPHWQSGFLVNIKQREGEFLHDYMNHFNVATLKMHNLDQSVTMIAFKDELQKNFLLYTLEKKYLKDFAEMLDRAEKYVWADEALKKYDTSTDLVIEEKKEDLKLLPI